AFNFYGNAFTQMFVSTNGLITFGTGNTAFTNADLTTAPAQATIAPFWDDLHITPAAAASVRWQVFGSGSSQQLVVQWNDVSFFPGNNANRIPFQAVLSEGSDTIQFNYLDLASSGAGPEGVSATVGIKDAGTQGPNRLLLAFNNGPNAFVGT